MKYSILKFFKTFTDSDHLTYDYGIILETVSFCIKSTTELYLPLLLSDFGFCGKFQRRTKSDYPKAISKQYGEISLLL